MHAQADDARRRLDAALKALAGAQQGAAHKQQQMADIQAATERCKCVGAPAWSCCVTLHDLLGTCRNVDACCWQAAKLQYNTYMQIYVCPLSGPANQFVHRRLGPLVPIVLLILLSLV